MIVYHTNQGSPLNVFTSVYEIVRRDTQLGEEPVADAQFLNQIFYTAPTDLDGFGRPFISKLVSSNAIIYVRAVGAEFILDDGTPITEAFGLTIPDGTLLLGNEELDAIVIYYDYTNGNGEGYALFGEGGEEICLPSFVLLGHELSHASHMIDGDHPEDIGEAHEEIIIPEENEIRAEHNLPLRDPANDGGNFPSETCATELGSGGSSSCFVMTSALGMERHDPIAALHELRQRVLGPTRFGALFYASLRREYYSFGPALADIVRHDARLRRAVREAVIEPFLGWATALDAYLSGDFSDDITSGAQVQLPDDPVGVERALCQLSALLTDEERASAETGKTGDVPFSELVDVIVSTVSSHCGVAPNTAWAIVEPARLYLAATGANSDRNFGAAMEHWLVSIPIPERFFSLRSAALARELNMVAHGALHGSACRGLIVRIEQGFRQRGRTRQAELLAEYISGIGGRAWQN